MHRPRTSLPHRRAMRRLLAGALLLGAETPPAWTSNDAVIRDGDLPAPRGQISLTQFADATGTAADDDRARQAWGPMTAGSPPCRFGGLPPGQHAVPIAHELIGNRRVDTCIVGMPDAPWGVSIDACPAVRAPRDGEAVFNQQSDTSGPVLRIEVAR